MKRIYSEKFAAWYGDGGNGTNVNIEPGKWDADKGISGRATGVKTEEEVKEEWGEQDDKKDKKDKKSKKSEKKKHTVSCRCGDKCNCGESCKCQKS